MTYKRFEDLPVWQAADSLARRVYDLVDDRVFSNKGDVRNQLQRAALSISLNIAEGFERGTKNELLNFLYIARGSAGEVRAALRFCEKSAWAVHRGPTVGELIEASIGISRQLGGWIDRLKNSEIKGQRYLTDATRHVYEQRKRETALKQNMREVPD
jgi:four helix bundle protein